MLDEKSRQDVDTNLQDVAQIPGRRLRLWSFVGRASVRAPMRAQRKIPVDWHFIVRLRSMGQGKTGASRSSLRDSVQEETVFAVLSRLKRFCGTIRLLRYILYRLKRLFGTKLCGQHQSGPENGVKIGLILPRFFKSRTTV